MYTALGALAVTEGIEPARRLQMVLDATALHDSYVRRPFTIEKADRFGLGQPSQVVYEIKSPHIPPGGTGIID